MDTPWGTSQSAKRYGEGITFYSTEGHGGFRVSEELLATMPDHLRDGYFPAPGWFEEDCAWAHVAVAFPDRFTPENVEQAKDTLKNWHPDVYEKQYGATLKPGESMKRDEELFNEAHKTHLVAVTAWGDWHKAVPKGFVGICCKVGGRQTLADLHTCERYFLVPTEEYQQRDRNGFVVEDPTKYTEVEEIQ